MKKKQFCKDGLYGIIDREVHKSITRTARDCLRAGIKIIQYRDKTPDIRGFYHNVRLLKKIIGNKALFIINDRADIASLVGCGGLHLGQDDLPVEAARRVIGGGKIIGKSCHSLQQALLAQKEGADYISIGPIFSTPTKPDYPAVGLSLLKQAQKKIKIPMVAIGGINKDNVRLVREAGARTIAVVRAINQAKVLESSLLQHSTTDRREFLSHRRSWVRKPRLS